MALEPAIGDRRQVTGASFVDRGKQEVAVRHTAAGDAVEVRKRKR